MGELVEMNSKKTQKAATIFNNKLDQATNALFAPIGKWSSTEKSCVLRMIDIFTKITKQNPSVTFSDIINDALRNDQSIKEFIDPLTKTLKNGSEEFPIDNLAYQAMVWLFRMKEKTDYHCHKSVGQHPSIVAKLISELEVEEYEKISNKIKGLVQKKKINQNVADEFEKLKKENELASFLYKTPSLRNWITGDFFEVNESLFKKALKETARNYLRDGVVSFGIRMNPFKNEFYKERTSIEDVFEKTILIAIRALDDVALEFEVPKKGLNIIISLNRTEKREKESLENMGKSLPKLHALDTEIRERILGLDISGTEYAGSETGHDPKQWNDIINELPKHMKLFPHVGDIRNIYTGNHILSEKWIAYLEKRRSLGIKHSESSETSETLELLFNVIKEHLEFCKKYIEVMPEGSALAHGTVLAHRNILFLVPPDTRNLGSIERKLYPFDLEGKESSQLPFQRDCLLKQLKEIKTTMLRKNIGIDFCPTTTVKTLNVQDFSKLPIYQWINLDKLRVRIGVDGIWDRPEPRTLSEELTRLFLTEPKIGPALSFEKTLNLVRN